jgi:hypothetical protein
VITDGWPAYQMATKGIYTHEHHVVPGSHAPLVLPGVHRVASHRSPNVGSSAPTRVPLRPIISANTSTFYWGVQEQSTHPVDPPDDL